MKIKQCIIRINAKNQFSFPAIYISVQIQECIGETIIIYETDLSPLYMRVNYSWQPICYYGGHENTGTWPMFLQI